MRTMTKPSLSRRLLAWLMSAVMLMGALNWAKNAPPANFFLVAQAQAAHTHNPLTHQGKSEFAQKDTASTPVGAIGGMSESIFDNIIGDSIPYGSPWYTGASMLIGGTVAEMFGRDGVTAALAALNAAQNNRDFEKNEKDWLKEKGNAEYEAVGCAVVKCYETSDELSLFEYLGRRALAALGERLLAENPQKYLEMGMFDDGLFHYVPTLSYTDFGKHYTKTGPAYWDIRWELDAPSPYGGWIVQEMSIFGEDSLIGSGTSASFKVRFWEAWPVPPGGMRAENGSLDSWQVTPASPGLAQGSRTWEGSARFYGGLTLPPTFVSGGAAPYAGDTQLGTFVNPNLPTSNASPPVPRDWTVRWNW